MPDLTYTTDSLFARFLPETPPGVDVWRQMNAADNGDVVLLQHLPSVLAQIRAAGYTVRKAQRGRAVANDDQLLNELVCG